ncbi:MAG TPA: CPBP family intramembrane glutamic endopeptidase [Herpetosiphonaceae bacterium]
MIPQMTHAPGSTPMDPSPVHRTWRHAVVGIGIVLLSLIQFKLITAIVHPVLLGLLRRFPALDGRWVVDLRLPALLWCCGWIVLARRLWGRPPHPAAIPWRRILVIASLTLLSVAGAIFGLRVWTQTVAGLHDIVVLVVIAVVIEELWFRGVVYTASWWAFPASRYAPILISAGLFSLGHWQYHGFQLTGAALAQMLYTLPLGLIFGYLRAATGGLTTGLIVHMVINALAVSAVLSFW